MNDPGVTRVAVYIDFVNIVISRYDQLHGRGQFQRDKVRGFDRAGRSADPDMADRLTRACRTANIAPNGRLRHERVATLSRLGHGWTCWRRSRTWRFARRSGQSVNLNVGVGSSSAGLKNVAKTTEAEPTPTIGLGAAGLAGAQNAMFGAVPPISRLS